MPPAPTTVLPPLHDTELTRWLKRNYPALYRQIQEFPWVYDGLSELEREAIDYLLYMENIANLQAALKLPWFQGAATDTELDATEWIRWLDAQSEKGAAAVIAMPWVQDGITETERDALEWLSWLAYDSEKAAAGLIAMAWFQDGITNTELDAINHIFWLNDEDDENGLAIIEAVLAFPWIQDGITATEAEFLVSFEYLEHYNEKDAAAILTMPFLESLEPDDVLAIRGIEELASNEDGDLLQALLGHPTLRSGITDAQTTLVVAAGTLREAEEVRRMLNPGYADIETLSKWTELTPNLKVSIVRTGTQPQPWTAGGVREAVEFVERIMQQPLPLSHIIVVLNDKAFTENYGGTNFGFAFGYDPEDEQPRDTLDGHYFQSGLVHETAHYFWRGHADWVDEGVADTFEYMYGVETGISPGLLEVTQREDCEAHDLEMLTEWNPEQQELDRFHCNYYLGQSLFLELLENLGEDEFKERLRELYRLSLAANEADRTPGIAEVRQAFHDQSEIVEKHWSGKLNALENRPFDEGVYRTNHDLIQWEQYPTYDGTSVTFRGTLLGDAVLPRETVGQAIWGDGYQNFDLYAIDGYEFAGFILPGGPNWSLKHPGDTVATEYRLDGRTFTVEFPFPKALSDPSGYVVHIWGYQDETKTPVFGKIDNLGYARIRLE